MGERLTHYDDVWTPKLVGEVLVDAAKWSIASAGRTGPADDRNGILEKLDPENVTPSRKRMLSPARVSLLEMAIHWPTIYLKGNDGAARVLQLWLRCKCTRYRFGNAVDDKGWSRATAYRLRDKALSTISQGLDRDRIEVPRR